MYFLTRFSSLGTFISLQKNLIWNFDYHIAFLHMVGLLWYATNKELVFLCLMLVTHLYNILYIHAAFFDT